MVRATARPPGPQDEELYVIAATVAGTQEDVAPRSSGPDRARTPPGHPWLLPAACYLTVLAAVLLVTWQTVAHLGTDLDHVVGFQGSGVLGGLSRYDGGWYHLISLHGYEGHTPGAQSPVAFFPGYPLAMRLLGAAVGDNGLAGILVTIASGLGAAALFRSWCRERMDAAAATTSLLVLLLYPYGYYLYGVMYADALFLVAALAGFTAVERDRPGLAGLAGAVATLTRPVGLAVAAGLAVRTLERRGVLSRPGWHGLPARLRQGWIRGRDGWVLVSISGLAAYMGYLWLRFGDPFLFSAVQEHWGQPSGPRTWMKLALYEHLRSHPDRMFTWGLVTQGLVALAALATVPLVGRRFGWGYATYQAVVLLIPLIGTKDFHGLGRYSIAAFPAFAIAGQFLTLRPRPARTVVLGSAAVLLLAGSAAFAHGLYLS